jgi:hypothetical protein
MARTTPKRARKKRKEWDTPTRTRIQSLRYDQHLSKRAIARQTQVPRRSVCRILDFESVRTARPQRGRPPKIDRDTVLKMEKEMDNNYKLGSATNEEIIEHFNLNCSVSTLVNAFKREGIDRFMSAQKDFLTIGHKERRECFCTDLRCHKGWTQSDLEWILFSDEAHCAVNQTKIDRVYRRRGTINGVRQRYRLDKIQKRHKVQKVSVSFWAMIGKGYKSPLVIIPRHLDMDTYTELILKPVVAPFFAEQRAKGCYKWLFQEDNDSAHGNGSVLNPCQDFKNEYKIRRLRPDWPALSPDLSPIERVWKILKQRVKKRKARNSKELQDIVLDEWDKITQGEIDNEISKEYKALDQCIDRRGDVTEF